jgi:hypothetical protein
MDNIEERVAELKAKIALYSLDDVYNMDETAYLYNLAPDKTIAHRQIEGGKKDKMCLTIAITCNATGTDHVELLILGHAQCKKLVSMSCLRFKFQGMYLPSEILPEPGGISVLFILKNLCRCVVA